MKLLSLHETADFLRVKPETVRRWAASGVIPVIRMNCRKSLFDMDQLQKALRKKSTRKRGVRA